MTTTRRIPSLGDPETMAAYVSEYASRARLWELRQTWRRMLTDGVSSTTECEVAYQAYQAALMSEEVS
jgi:hypothetical protein